MRIETFDSGGVESRHTQSKGDECMRTPAFDGLKTIMQARVATGPLSELNQKYEHTHT